MAAGLYALRGVEMAHERYEKIQWPGDNYNVNVNLRTVHPFGAGTD